LVVISFTSFHPRPPPYQNAAYQPHIPYHISLFVGFFEFLAISTHKSFRDEEIGGYWFSFWLKIIKVLEK